MFICWSQRTATDSTAPVAVARIAEKSKQNDLFTSMFVQFENRTSWMNYNNDDNFVYWFTWFAYSGWNERKQVK